MDMMRGNTRRLMPLLLLIMVTAADAQEPVARDEAWRQDLNFVLSDFLPKDKSFGAETRARSSRRIAALRDSVPLLSNEQIMTRLAAAVASSGNAHTRLYLVRNRSEVRRYPFRIWRFPDGWYITRARPEYSHLLGTQITSLGGRPIDSIANLVEPLYAGEPGWRRYMATYTLTSPEILKGVGVSLGAGDQIVLRGVSSAGSITESVVPLPLKRGSFVTESWWDLSPRHPGNDGPWLSAIANVKLPLYLQQPQRHYWMTFDAARQLLYVQYNRAQNEPGRETVRAFGAAALDTIRKLNPAKLVIDLRFNTGGNLMLGDSLFRGVASLPLAQQRGRLFVITSGNTFSAGMTPAAVLRQLTNAVFVGEPVGDALDYWSEGGNLLLPNSQLTVHYANGFHGYSGRRYPEREPFYYDLDVETLAPHIPVATTWTDYLNGRDAALDAVFGYDDRR